MSTRIIDELSHICNYEHNIDSKVFLNKGTPTTPDIDELMEIVTVLESYDINYELTSHFDLNYL